MRRVIVFGWCAGAMALAVLAACRYEVSWSGARFTEDGQAIQAAAQEPLCGCLTLENKGPEPIHLTVRQREQFVGDATLQPGATGEWRFDWAGEADDWYLITGTTARGEPVTLSERVEISAMNRWSECDELKCQYGSLLMDLADVD